MKNWIDQMEVDIFIASTVDLEDQIFFSSDGHIQ
jgi:hypothetical protein